MKRFWEIRARADDPARGEMTLYGEISDASWFGDETTPAQVAEELKALGDITALDVYINSPGGDVFAGLAIYNILRRLEGVRVTAHVDGLAASAASVIVMAADRIVMPRNALLMIHRAWAYANGNAAELQKMADTLERIDGQLAQIYADRGGQSREKMAALMEAETWMDAAQAAELGLCDEIEENKTAASVTEILTRYRNWPLRAKGACHGGGSQPVEDKATEEPAAPATESRLAEQRRRFDATRRKILHAMGGNEK